MAILRGDPLTAQRLSVEAAELAEDLGRQVLAHALRLGGEAQMRLGDLANVQRLSTELSPSPKVSTLPKWPGCDVPERAWHSRLQDWEQARVHAGEAIETSGLAHTMRRTAPQWVLGMVNLFEGDLDTAREGFQEGLAAAEQRGAPRHEAAFCLGLVAVSTARRRLRGGEPCGALDLWRSLGDRRGGFPGGSRRARGGGTEQEGAAELLGAAESLRDRAGAKATPREAAQVAAITASHGRISQPRAWPLGQSWTNPTPSPRPADDLADRGARSL